MPASRSPQLRSLQLGDWAAVYDLMVQQDFPDTPDNLDAALGEFAQTQGYGLYSPNGELQAAFILMDFIDQAACLDVVCAPAMHGKWATPRTLRRLYETLFVQHGLAYLWAEPKTPRALQTCLQAGFQLLQLAPQQQTVVVLSRRGLWQRFHKILSKENH